MMMMMMTMWFHFREGEFVLFNQWHTQSTVAYIFSCVGVCVIGFVYELIRFARAKAQEHGEDERVGSLSFKEEDHSCCHADEDFGVVRNEKKFSQLHSLVSGVHVGDTILYFLQLFGSYCMMLIWMTYNVPLCLAITLGHTLGFFFLGPLMSVKQEQAIGDCCS